MDIIAKAGLELAVEEAEFATPETARERPIRNTDQIEAFQSMVHSLDCWPLHEPMTGWDVRLLANQALHDAQTRYLRRLADF
jgi:hypothetical protein